MLMQKIKREDPRFYRFAMARLNGQLGQEEPAVEERSWFDKLADAATSFYQIKQQKDIMDMQVKRAERGLPPLDTRSLAPPPVRIEVSAPEFAPTFQDAKKLLLPIAGAGIAYLLFKRR